MPAIFSLFNILALLYVFRTAQLSITIWREWADFKSEPLTPHKKSLANQASFFIAVPISVFVHEAAHAIAVIATGGEVVEFQYRVFWGYVVPGGTFSAVEMWFIAIAGTLGSLLTGLLIWLATRNAQSSSIRYFGLRAARFQIYFSLIYYPLFTLLGFDGDWRTIYNFSSTPWLSGSTLFFHIAILLLFWRFDRQGWFEAPAFPDEVSQQQFEQLSATAIMNSDDIALQLEIIDILRRGGATHKARYQLNKLIEQHADSGLAQLELAAIESSGKDTVSKKAADSAQKALDLGLSNAGQNAFAYELIGRYQMERGDLQNAQTSFSEAIEALMQGGNRSALIGLLILRNQVYRRQQNYNAAYQDLQHALAIAQQSTNGAAVQQINSELEILAKHSGQLYSTPL
jgi:tetratricopeptide (TPR) repeat protein